uniref:HAT C-terminal dimerisation domain-containing protein n=1 Tax=Chenopodium quinoa TaxID=63459 RepID=A0A803LEB2_CHEQI
MANFGSWMSSQQQNVNDKSQLDLYVEEKNVDFNSKIDVLVWWKNNRAHRHPQLAALVRDILAIPISSVPSESAFSMGKKLINPWRASLTSMTIESLSCYEDWLRAKGGSNIFSPQNPIMKTKKMKMSKTKFNARLLKLISFII